MKNKLQAQLKTQIQAGYDKIKRMAKNFLERLRKTKEPKIIMRKTYRKAYWKRMIKPALIAAAVLMIVALVFFAVKNRKQKRSSPVEDEISASVLPPGEIIEKENLNEASPPGFEIISQGRFKSIEQPVKGKALFVKSEGKIFLRLEDFQTLNAQDLHIYLSPILNLDPNDSIDLGMLKATSGNMNYELDKSADLEKYNNVLVWTNRFKAFFGYATLLKGDLPPEETEADISGDQNASSDDQGNPNQGAPAVILQNGKILEDQAPLTFE